MPDRKPPTPPRPIAPGDIVATYSELLGEWTAAQITSLDPESELAAVLELDWSGPEPSSVADLGELVPLRHINHEWVLPRRFKVVGSAPVLRRETPNTYSTGWWIGLDLFLQRRKTRGENSPWFDSTSLEIRASELQDLAEPSGEHIRTLTVRDIGSSLDCARLVDRFPHLTDLHLYGSVGRLESAASLNRLTRLRRIYILDLFGMTGSDCLRPEDVPELEYVMLDSIPADYATATKKVWRPETPQGVYLGVRKPRKPEWVATNVDNPLRHWDGDSHIDPSLYRKVIAQYEATRRDARALLHIADDPTRLYDVGRQYGEAFNQLDAEAEFIYTTEREDLFEALDFIVTQAEAELGLDLAWARTALIDGLESVRDW